MSTADRPEPLSREGLAVLVAAATTAPSVHNSQPWQFRAAGDAVELRLDRTRELPVADPGHRESVISCGAALEGLVLAMEHLRHRAEVAVLPDGRDPDHLATVRRGARHDPSPDSERRYAALATRHMHRMPFARRPLAAHLVAEVAQAARHGTVWCREVRGPDQRWLLGEVSAQAAGELLGDPAYRAELAGWTRWDTRRGDGVPFASLGEEPYPVNGLPWGLYADAAVDADAFAFDVFLLIGTGEDTMRDWLAAGRALMRVLLHGACRGVAASLLTQPMEVATARRVLVVGLNLPGAPQVLLRLGHPAARPPGSPRRPIAEVLTD
jgi:hypothetical protein